MLIDRESSYSSALRQLKDFSQERAYEFEGRAQIKVWKWDISPVLMSGRDKNLSIPARDVVDVKITEAVQEHNVSSPCLELAQYYVFQYFYEKLKFDPN